MSQAKLSCAEMIVRKIMQAEGTEAEQDANVALFQANCLHSDGRMVSRTIQLSQSRPRRKSSIEQCLRVG
jgi:hypothetical protein